MKSKADLVEYLRDHIVGAMHVGQVRAGDRLPSIREVAELFGKNARTVKAAYEVLEQERLVEVRGRSGVFVSPQEIPGCQVSAEIARWMSGMVAEAWNRRIPLAELPTMVQRMTLSQRVRCVLVELIEDGVVAFSHELENDWGFDVQVRAPDALDDAGDDVDVFATTSFYAPLIHDAVEALGKPLIVLTTHAGLQAAIRQRINNEELTVVAVDRRFGDRMRMAYAPGQPERVRLVLASDSDAVAQLDPDEPILLTRAAREVLGRAPAPLIFPHSPTLSAETARALARILVRKNVTSL